MEYIALGLITYVALISIAFIVADSLRSAIAKCREFVEQSFKLMAGKRGGLFYMVNGKRRYI